MSQKYKQENLIDVEYGLSAFTGCIAMVPFYRCRVTSNHMFHTSQ